MECRTIVRDSLPRLLRNRFGGLKKIFLIVFFLNLAGTYHFLQAQRLSRDQKIGLLTNQIGYLPSSTKTCLVQGTEKRDFEVVEIPGGKVVYKGSLIPQTGDFGTYAGADFSAVAK